MAASNFTELYNNGSWGYKGIGPMPAKSFTLTLTADSTNNLFSLGSCTSTHIVAYNPNNTAQYAVYSGTSFTVYGSGAYELVRYPANATPSTQSITIDYDPSKWDFHGLASLEGAALCIATNTSGSAPDGHDYASIAAAKKNMFWYEVIVIRMADKINGCDIYAKRAEQDKDGNDIVSIPSVTGNAGKILAVNSGATGTEWVTKPTTPTVDQTYNSSSSNAQSGVAVAGALATVNQVPASTSSDEDKVLTVNSSGTPVWAAAQGGSSYTAGAGIDITSDVVSAKIDNSTLTTDASGTDTAYFTTQNTYGYDVNLGNTRIMSSLVSQDTKVYTFHIPTGGIQLGNGVYSDNIYPVLSTGRASDGELRVNQKLNVTYDTSTYRYVITGGQTFKICFNADSPYFPVLLSLSYPLDNYRYLTFGSFSASQIEDNLQSNELAGAESNSASIDFDYKTAGTTLSVNTDVVQPKLTAGEGIAISDSNVISIDGGEEVPITSSTSNSYYLGVKLNYNHLRIYFHKYNGSSSSGHLVKDVYSDVSFSNAGGITLSEFYYGTLGTTTFSVSSGSTFDTINVGSNYFSFVSGNSVSADQNSSWVIDKIIGFNDSPFVSQS